MLGNHNLCPMCRAAIFEWTTLTALADQDQLGVGAAGPPATGAAGNNAGSSTLKAYLPRMKVPTVLAYEKQSETGDSGSQRLGED